jgi:hypothetical protein
MGLGVKKHYQGWVLFVKLAITSKGDLFVSADNIGIFLNRADKALVRVDVGKAVETSNIIGIACVHVVNDAFGDFQMDNTLFVTKANQIGYGISVR